MSIKFSLLPQNQNKTMHLFPLLQLGKEDLHVLFSPAERLVMKISMDTERLPCEESENL